MAETLNITRRGKGLPVVLLHGWGLNSGVWEPLIEYLHGSFEFITVDLPGFGKNVEHTIADYSLGHLASEIEKAIDFPAIYLGWSLGGLIANQLAISSPKKVLGVINVATSPCFVEKKSWPGIRANVLRLFHQQLAENTQKTITNFLNIQAMGSPHVKQDVKNLKSLIMQYPMPNRSTLDDALKLLEDVDLRSELMHLSQPTLCLFGQLDTLVPRDVIPLIHSLIPHASIHIFDKASHAPFISHRDDFVKVLKDWIFSLEQSNTELSY